MMQPVWESAKGRDGVINYRSNYHRAVYDIGYDNYNDIYYQRWRKEVQRVCVVCMNESIYFNSNLFIQCVYVCMHVCMLLIYVLHKMYPMCTIPIQSNMYVCMDVCNSPMLTTKPKCVCMYVCLHIPLGICNKSKVVYSVLVYV